MGCKVSTGKMAAVSRVVQVVRPHAPLIRFPDRQAMLKPSVHDELKTLIGNLPSTAAPAAAPAAAQSTTPPPKPAGPVSRLPGTPDTINVVKEFPQKYRRQALALEEMDYIQRGGPE